MINNQASSEVTSMKVLLLALTLPLAACVSIDLPGLVSDTAKVGKDAYQSIAGKKAEEKPKEPAAASADYITHATVGQASQTIAEIRDQCVREAVEKLNQLSGKEVQFTVLENTIGTVNNSVVANCKVAIATPAVAATDKK
jgi:hypothetical protein